MKIIGYVAIAIIVLAVLITGALDEDNYARGGDIAALLTLAALPFFMLGVALYRTVRLRKKTGTSWRTAFLDANDINKPPVRKKK